MASCSSVLLVGVEGTAVVLMGLLALVMVPMLLVLWFVFAFASMEGET